MSSTADSSASFLFCAIVDMEQFVLFAFENAGIALIHQGIALPRHRRYSRGKKAHADGNGNSGESFPMIFSG